jgi:hypothetical protein
MKMNQIAKTLRNWLKPLAGKPQSAKKAIFWVIEESEAFECCTAIKFYNQFDELLHCEEMKGIDYKTLSSENIKELNRKAKQILLQKLGVQNPN